MQTSQILIMITIIAYLGIMVVIGIIYSKRNKSSGDYYLGGRKLGPIVTAMSAEASDMSSWLLMGLPGVALIAGLPEATWTAIGLAAGTYLNWLIVAKRLRLYSQKIGAITIPQFFAKRYKDGKVLSLISAIMIVVFFVPYTASGFNACGTLFATLFGVDYFWAMLISAVVIVTYTSMGGFSAASTTDLIQSIVMSVALIIVVVFGINMAGGWGAVVENAKSLPGYLDLTKGFNAATGSADTYSPLTIVSTLAWGIGYFGMPHILLRFMAIEKPDKLSTSRRIATIWVVISMGVAVLIGIVGNAMVANGSLEKLAASDSQRIIIVISTLLSTFGPIAAIIAGIIFAGILASTMSTSDSQLLAASSSITEDIVQKVFGVKLSGKKEMLFARLTVIAIAVVSVIWARDEGSVFTIVSFAWAGFGAAFGPTMLLALFWKRSNRWGAISGIIAGGTMVFIWKYAVRPMGGVLDIYELLPAFLIGLGVNVLVSLLTVRPDKETEEEFESVGRE